MSIVKWNSIRRGAIGAIVCAGVLLTGAEDSSVRTIRLRQDDAQTRFASKLYELKNVNADEILPFVNSAVLRYSSNSTVSKVTSGKPECKGALLVSTGKEFIPQVDSIIAALDRKGGITGTGVARVAYSPKFRAAAEFANIIDTTASSNVGKAYVNAETNTIFWRDQTEAAKRTLAFVEKLDRPLPQVQVRLNYYEMRDSDLRDLGMDYLAWKNGPGVNLFNAGYNAGRIVFDQALNAAVETALNFTTSWGMGGFFTAPSFDMSFIRCLEQAGNANAVAHSSVVMVNTPVGSEADYVALLALQNSKPETAPFIYRVSMQPEYQNIAKNTLGRSFIGKSFYEDENGVQYSNPPSIEAKIVNPFICFGAAETDAQGFIPSSPEFYKAQNELGTSGGVIFDYSIFFKHIVERGNTGAELNNSSLISGASTLAFGKEKILAVYEKENDVEQTIGLPILCRIPVLKYLFSTTTTIKERTYIVVSAEASLVSPENGWTPADKSISTGIERRIENPFRAQNN